MTNMFLPFQDQLLATIAPLKSNANVDIFRKYLVVDEIKFVKDKI